MTDWVWMRHEFPWLGGGFVHAVGETYADEFERDLVHLGFELHVLHGDLMSDEAAFWGDVKRAFNFPDYCGNNWDAFNDSFGELGLPPRLAVVWRRADDFASRHLKLFGEAIAILHETLHPLQECQGVVVITGHGAEFHRPG